MLIYSRKSFIRFWPDGQVRQAYRLLHFGKRALPGVQVIKLFLIVILATGNKLECLCLKNIFNFIFGEWVHVKWGVLSLVHKYQTRLKIIVMRKRSSLFYRCLKINLHVRFRIAFSLTLASGNEYECVFRSRFKRVDSKNALRNRTCKCTLTTKRKCFKTITPGTNVIKLFKSIIYE
jgi:hypothetical protein